MKKSLVIVVIALLSTFSLPSFSEADRDNKFYFKLYDVNYHSLAISAEQIKSIKFTRYDYWVTDGQNPEAHEPVCELYLADDKPKPSILCYWDVGRKDNDANLTKFKSYLTAKISSSVTAGVDGELQASLPKKDMNFGWAGSLDFKLYNRDLCQKAGDLVPTQTLHMYFVLGQTGTGGIAKLLYQTYKTTKQVFKCDAEVTVGDEDPKCEYKLVKDFKELGDDIENLYRNVWSIGTHATKTAQEKKIDTLLEGLKAASKILKTTLTVGGEGENALVGYLQDDDHKSKNKYPFMLRQSKKVDDDHTMDLILSDQILNNIYDSNATPPVCEDTNKKIRNTP